METQTGSFGPRVLGRTGREVSRLGVAASYGAPCAAVESAFEHGVNYLYWGSQRTEAFGQALRSLRGRRDRIVLVVQSYTRWAALMAGSLEKALRGVQYDYADILLLGLWNKPVAPRILDAARNLRERGLVRYLAVSTHMRKLVPAIAAGRDFDVVHFRYNAAHPGAETDIFPHLPADGRPGLTAFTATSWGQLLGVHSIQSIFNGGSRLPAGERVPTAVDCYRFVLTRSEVDVCMTGPASEGQMAQALEALKLGPMDEGELAWMRRVGRAVSAK